jgi:hypothetical protein
VTRSTRWKGLRIGIALLPILAIAATVVDLAGRGVLNPVNFFSYFTIQSNLIGVAAFLLAATSPNRTRGIDLLRGASVVYLSVTFVVFALLLSGTNVDTAMNWVDFILHKLFPIAVVVDWLIDPPRRRITPREAVGWLAYPLVWVAYTLIRGPIANWYPYPFMDPANGGYATVAAYVVGIVIFGILVIALIAGVGNALRGGRPPQDVVEPVRS